VSGSYFFVFFCEVTCSVLVLVFVESGALVAFALGFDLVSWPCGDSAGFEELLSHAVVFEGVFVCSCAPFLELWCGFRCGCAVAVDKITDRGLLALAGAGVGPGLEHLEFRSESPDFESNSWYFSVVVFTSALPSSALIVLLIFGFLFS